MEEQKKIFSQQAIAIATYIGGPVAAAYLVKKNYQAFDQDDNGKKALIIGIISTILLFAGIFSIPEHIIDKIPNMVIPTIYTIIIYFIVDKKQGNWLKTHKEEGGAFHSKWRAAGIGGIALAIMLVIAAGVVLITEDNYDKETYDKDIAVFLDNENRSIEVLSIIDKTEPQLLIGEFKKSIALWKENKEIIENLNLLENLPTELLEQNEKLLEYADLRIQYHEALLKTIVEDTDAYLYEIEQLQFKINDILDATTVQ